MFTNISPYYNFGWGKPKNNQEKKFLETLKCSVLTFAKTNILSAQLRIGKLPLGLFCFNDN